MRIGILAIQHESNTFAAEPTPLASFEEYDMQVGEMVLKNYQSTHHEVTGFLKGLEQAGAQPIPLLVTRAAPSGPIAADATNRLLELAWQQLEKAGQLDGILVAPHGAGVSELYRDFDGHWLTELRKRVGNDMPIVCTLDPHANVSPRMIQACNATVAYRTNPHLDQLEVGKEAAGLITRHVKGEVKLTQKLVRPNVAISIDQQETSAQPCLALYERANEMLTRPGVLSNSIILGFPYADCDEMGSAFITVTDDNPALAEQCGRELATYLVEHREDYACGLAEVDDAIADVKASTDRVCLLDVGDNVGGGSSADGTTLAHALHNAGVDRSLILILDPEATAQAREAGVGATLELTMGAKADDLHGQPFTATVTVIKLADGKYHEPEARHGGRSDYDQGPTAIVRTDRGLSVMLYSRREPPFSLHQILDNGIDPKDYRVFVAKGVNAPIAAYKPVCDRFVRVNTPGTTGADMTRFNYQHRPAPLYPFETDITVDMISVV